VTRNERHRLVGAWAAELGTRKLVLVRARGGIGPHSGEGLELSPGHQLATSERGISVINLHRDHDALRASTALTQEEKRLLEGVSQAMQVALSRQDGSAPLPKDRLVTSVTAPSNLLNELFTVRGAGTLIKHGSRIDLHAGYSSLDLPRLTELLERTFSRRLQPSFFSMQPRAVYVEQAYRGAAIVSERQGMSFLSKFVVDRLAQGLGIGGDLWAAVTRDHECLFWRARAANPITRWYESQCQGMLRTGYWNVYFRGVRPDQIPALVADATSLPSDFEE
jgi:acetylglutamate kinase